MINGSHWPTILLLLALTLTTCTGLSPAPQPPCPDHLLQRIEQQVGTGDGQGHGPDIGSAEWHSVVEFRLGIRDNTDVPEPATRAWCAFILEQHGTIP